MIRNLPMRRSCRSIALLACLCASLPVVAQGQVAVPPPVQDVKPPALEVIDDSVQPQVTIRKRGEDAIEEYRINGQLYKVVVTPARGAPYTLIDPKGDGDLIPMDNGGPKVSVPMWEIGTF